MNNTSEESVSGGQMNRKLMNELQDRLDAEVLERDELDIDKVKEILTQMEEISPEKASFDKSAMWDRIQQNSKPAVKVKCRARSIALTAATIVLAVFVGANLGTYATEKKNVFEYVGDLVNGTAFRVTGDATNMDVQLGKTVYYSWNDIPNVYKTFLIVPVGLPEYLNLYDISVSMTDGYESATIRYMDGTSTNNYSLQIYLHDEEQYTFVNLMQERKYDVIEQEKINDIDVYYYGDEKGDIIAQFFYNKYVYMFSGSMDIVELKKSIEETIEFNM